MKLIATHNSATGEKPKNLLSVIMLPFSKTQSKTLEEQYDAGCRMFDLRFKENKDGNIYCKHGAWTSAITLTNALTSIHQKIKGTVRCYVSLTYEGKADKERQEWCKKVYAEQKELFPKIRWQYLAVKYGVNSEGVKCSYDILEAGEATSNRQGFQPLDGRSWHTILPIPWLWKKLLHDKPVFDEKVWTYVDFL